MADTKFYITSGLPVAKNTGQSPGASENTVYITSGLSPEVLTAAEGNPWWYYEGMRKAQ